MAKLHSHQDSRIGCWASIMMDNGDPCYISVARSGVLVKRSRIGFLGAKPYEQGAYGAAMTAKALAYLLDKAGAGRHHKSGSKVVHQRGTPLLDVGGSDADPELGGERGRA